jgi:transposase InsO family protein
MDEEIKKQVAVFRFGVIADLVTGGKLDRGEAARLIREKSERRWEIPDTNRTRISQSTIAHWIRLYRRKGCKLDALYPQSRGDEGLTRSLDSETAEALIKLRGELPRAPIPRLIEELRRRRIVGPQEPLFPSAVYRFLHRQGLMHPQGPPAVDRRRFEAESPNELWQADALHGPMATVSDHRRKTYLIAFIDDHSRLIPHGQFYLSEGVSSYLDCLRQALLKRGLPRRIYVDNGSALRSHHLEQVCASLGIALIHSRVREPAGRGKIERVFRTVRGNFLSAFQEGSLEGLNQDFSSWVDTWYHTRIHGTTHETPMARFSKGLECIRPAPRALEDHFRAVARRRVERDRAVVFQNRLYEAPVSLIGKRVSLLYHEHDLHRIEICYEGRSYGFLVSTDLVVNTRVRRDRPQEGTPHRKNPEPPEPPPPPITGGKLPLNPSQTGGSDHE